MVGQTKKLYLCNETVLQVVFAVKNVMEVTVLGSKTPPLKNLTIMLFPHYSASQPQ